MTSLFDMKVGQQAELWRILDSAGITLEQGQEILRQPDLATTMASALREQLSPNVQGGPILDLCHYFNPQQVVAQMKKLNKTRGKKHGWQFKSDDFNALPMPPAWPTNACLPAIVLCANLDSVANTFTEACIAAKRHQTGGWEQILEPSHLTLRFAEFRPNTLWWEVIDLAANWYPKEGRRVCDLVDPQLAHVQCLWAADQYPEVWVQAQSTSPDGMPYVEMAGYCYAGVYTPFFNWRPEASGVEMGYRGSDDWHFLYAAPLALRAD